MDRYCLKTKKFETFKLTPIDYNMLKWYFSLRTPYTCENAIVDSFLWSKYYDSKYFFTKKGLIWILSNKDGVFTTAPLCKNEDLKECFTEAKEYFNEVLHEKLIMYLVDEEAVNILNLDDSYEIIEERQYYDYVYDGDKMRTLSGKAYHKKKNHVNAFYRDYGDRYEYKTLSFQDKNIIMNFLNKWEADRGLTDEFNRIESEYEGIKYFLERCSNVKSKIGGIFIDGVLEAFSIGSYSKSIDMAYIHIEKANPNIRGLYPAINQQFLLHEFSNVKYVNREDDMGLEGLRKSKLSYNPIELVKKYTIIEK